MGNDMIGFGEKRTRIWRNITTKDFLFDFTYYLPLVLPQRRDERVTVLSNFHRLIKFSHFFELKIGYNFGTKDL